jgi:hypothetical protein
VRKLNKTVLQMPLDAARAPVSATENSCGWTLVDFLFPSQRRPVWTGSVSDEIGAVLAKTA